MSKRSHEGSPWHKSSYSAGEGSCVEVAEGPSVLIRDTQHRDLGTFEYPASAWAVFLREVKRGAFSTTACCAFESAAPKTPPQYGHLA